MRTEAERVLREEPAKLNVPAGNLFISPEDYTKAFITDRPK
jgi:hypothetical protein